MQTTSKESEDVVVELRNKPRDPIAGANAIASAMEGGHQPTMIFSSHGKNRVRKTRSESFYVAQDTPTVIRSRWSSVNESAKSSPLLNHDVSATGDIDTKNDVKSQSLKRKISNEPLRSKSAPPEKLDLYSTVSRKRPIEILSSRSKSQDKTEIWKRTSDDRQLAKGNAQRLWSKRASPLPLIPPPASLLKRQGSLSSASFSSPSSTPHTSPRSPPPLHPAPGMGSLLPSPPQSPVTDKDPEVSETSIKTLPTSAPTPPPPTPPETPPPQPPSQHINQSTTDFSLLPPPPPLPLTESRLSQDRNNVYIRLPSSDKALHMIFSNRSDCLPVKTDYLYRNAHISAEEQATVIETTQGFQPNPTVLTDPVAAKTTFHISPLSSRLTAQIQTDHNAGEEEPALPGAEEGAGRPTTTQSISSSEALGYFDAALNNQSISLSSLNATRDSDNSFTLDNIIFSSPPEKISEKGECNDNDLLSSDVTLRDTTRASDLLRMSTESPKTNPENGIDLEYILQKETEIDRPLDDSNIELFEKAEQSSPQTFTGENQLKTKSATTDFDNYELSPSSETEQDNEGQLNIQGYVSPYSPSSDNDDLEDQPESLSRGIFKEGDSAQRGRRRQREKRKSPKVTKLKSNVKTVRAHIKKGTVDELATLFSQDHPESVLISSQHTATDSNPDFSQTGSSDFNLDYENVIISHMKPQNMDTEIKAQDESSDKHQSSGPKDVLASQSSNSYTTIPAHPDASTQQSELRVEIKENDSRQERNGFDYLSASREIFKQVVRSDSKSPRNSLRKTHPQQKVNNIYSNTRGAADAEDKANTRSLGTGTETVHFPAANVHEQKDINSSDVKKEENAQTDLSLWQDSPSNSNDISAENKQTVHTQSFNTTTTSTRSTDGALLTSASHYLVSESILGSYVNSAQHKEHKPTYQACLHSERSTEIDEAVTKELENHVSRIERSEDRSSPYLLHTSLQAHSGAIQTTKDDPPRETAVGSDVRVPVTTYDSQCTDTTKITGVGEGPSVSKTGFEVTDDSSDPHLPSLSAHHKNSGEDGGGRKTEGEVENVKVKSDKGWWESGSERSTSSAGSNVNLSTWTITEVLEKKPGARAFLPPPPPPPLPTVLVATTASTTSSSITPDTNRALVSTEPVTGNLSGEAISPALNTEFSVNSVQGLGTSKVNEANFRILADSVANRIVEEEHQTETFERKKSVLSFSDHRSERESGVGGEEDGPVHQGALLHNTMPQIEEDLPPQTHGANKAGVLAHSVLEFGSEDEGEDSFRGGEQAVDLLPELQRHDGEENHVKNVPSVGSEGFSVSHHQSVCAETSQGQEPISEFRDISGDSSDTPGFATLPERNKGHENASDDFLSILDSIEIHADLTSEFVGKSNRQRVYTGEKSRSESPDKSGSAAYSLKTDNDLQGNTENEPLQQAINSFEQDKREIVEELKRTDIPSELKKREHSSSSSSSNSDNDGEHTSKTKTETNASSNTVAAPIRATIDITTISTPTTTIASHKNQPAAIAAHHTGGLEEELHFLHTSLSPQVSDNAVEEKLLPVAPDDDNGSNVGSVSSRASNSSKLKETVFNSAFFTSGELITEGEEGEVGSNSSLASKQSSKGGAKSRKSSSSSVSNKSDKSSDKSRAKKTSTSTSKKSTALVSDKNIKSKSNFIVTQHSDKENKYKNTAEDAKPIAEEKSDIHKVSLTNNTTSTSYQDKNNSLPDSLKVRENTIPTPPVLYHERVQHQSLVDSEENFFSRDQFVATKSVFERGAEKQTTKEPDTARKRIILPDLLSPSVASSYTSNNSATVSSTQSRPPADIYSAIPSPQDLNTTDYKSKESAAPANLRDQTVDARATVTHDISGYLSGPSTVTANTQAALRQRNGYLDSDLDQQQQPVSSDRVSGLNSSKNYRSSGPGADTRKQRDRSRSKSSGSNSSSDSSTERDGEKREKRLRKRKSHEENYAGTSVSSQVQKNYYYNRPLSQTTTTITFPAETDTLQKQPRRASTSSSSSDDNSFKDVIKVISGFNNATSNSYTDTRNISDTDNSMTAAVGEVSTFAIHKKMMSEEKSLSMTSDNTMPHSNGVIVQNGGDNDIYLIQDNKGEYYALQEVDRNNVGAPVGNNVTAHIINSSNVASRKISQQQSSTSITSPSSSRTSSIDYILSSSSQQQGGGNLVVDGSNVEEDTAREVISAFLESQSPTHVSTQYSAGGNTSYRSYYDSGAAERSGALKQVQTQGDLRGDTDGAFLFSSNSQQQVNNAQRNVLVDGHSVRNEADGPNNITFYNPHFQSDTLKNSIVTLQNEVNTRIDNSQIWTAPGFEPYTTGSGAEDHHSSSVHITNLNTPNQSVMVNRSHAPGIDTINNTGLYSGMLPSAHNQALSVNTNQISAGQDIAPFQTTPISITTTTQAVVGEKVDMQIEFPERRVFHRQISTTTDSSGDESSPQRFVVRSSPKKSSLKKTSKYDSSSLNDSSSDIVYTKKETVAADINIGGKKREIILHPVDPSTGQYESVNLNESYASDGHLYKVYGEDNAPPRREIHNNREDQENWDKNYTFTKKTYERPSRSLPRSSSEHNLFDGYSSSPDKVRGRTKHRLYSPREGRGAGSDSGRSYKIRHNKQPHSPERFFKNPKLSLHRVNGDNYLDDTDVSRGYYSEFDIPQPKNYKTVTKVYLDGDESRSPSPTSNRYKVTSSQSQSTFDEAREEINERQGQTRYRVLHSADGEEDFPDFGGGFKENQKRYRVFGQSDSALNSRHNLNVFDDSAHNRTLEEATITRTERFQPSRLHSLPRMGKSHKTVIQLEVDKDKKIRQMNTNDNMSDTGETHYRVNHSGFLDDNLSPTIVPVNTAPPLSSTFVERDWRTDRTSSRSQDSDSYIEAPNDNEHPAMRTLKQKSGNKMYVVHSTVGEPHDSHGNVVHLPGWHKSTIDINEDHPEQTRRIADERYKTEKSVYFVRQISENPAIQSKLSQRTYSTEFVSPDSGQGTEVASSDGENETVRQKFERVERIYEVRTEPEIPEHLKSTEDLSNDLRVLRGKILIKNRLDESEHGDDEFDENANLFDNSFHLGKDNPLYSSDQDLLDSLRREEEQEMMSRQVTQDITFEQVQRIAQRHQGSDGQVKLSPKPRRKQNLSTLLLSKIANVDSKDIRQTIDVEHHNEEIYGDIDFIHADGARTSSKNTSNFDSVNENVELTLTQGKAYVIIKVIAERIVPTDYEFNVWRKSQAIVTRRIEIDLLANEQRRRLYKDVMDSAGSLGAVEDGRSGGMGRYSHTDLSPQERQLSSMETLRLFSQILDVADGQGDRDHTDMRTKQEMGQLSGPEMDLLY